MRREGVDFKHCHGMGTNWFLSEAINHQLWANSDKEREPGVGGGSEIPLGIPFEVSRGVLVRTRSHSRRFGYNKLYSTGTDKRETWGTAGSL